MREYITIINIHASLYPPYEPSALTLSAHSELCWRYLRRHVQHEQDPRNPWSVGHAPASTVVRLFYPQFTTEADSDLVCQPGVGWMEINETLQEKGTHAKHSVMCQSRSITLGRHTFILSSMVGHLTHYLCLTISCLVGPRPRRNYRWHDEYWLFGKYAPDSHTSVAYMLTF